MEYYWYLHDNGVPHPDAAAFKFTDTSLNEPGAAPFAGALALYRDIYYSKLNTDVTSCEHADIVPYLEANPDVLADFRTYTLSKEFSTSIDEMDVTSQHLFAVGSANAPGSNYALTGNVQIVDGSLMSDGLSLVSTSGNDAVVANAGAGVRQFMVDLQGVTLTIYTGGTDNQFDPLAAITTGQAAYNTPRLIETGLAPSYDEFTIEPVLVLVGEVHMVTVSRVDYQGYYFLADGSTGYVSGPFNSGDAMKAGDIVAAHPELAGETAITAFATASTCVPVAALWPWGLIPWSPGPLPTPPPSPPWVPTPGTTTPWTCVPGPLIGSCTCQQTTDYTRTWPRTCVPIIGWPCWTPVDDGKERTTCTFVNPGPGPCVPAGPPPVTTVPPCSNDHKWQ